MNFLTIKNKFKEADKARDLLVKFYRSIPKSTRPKPQDFDALSSVSFGAIGDAVNGASFFESAYLQGQKRYMRTTNRLHWIVKDFCPYFLEGEGTNVFPTEKLSDYDVGNGCYLQQFQTALGLKKQVIPKATLATGQTVKDNKVAIVLSTGKSAFVKHEYFYPRQIYPWNLPIIQQFINENKNLEFVELGKEKSILKGVTDFTNREIRDSIIELSTCSKLICLNSGFLHLGVGLGLKCVCIINIPKLEHCYLPVLRESPIEDAAWIPFSFRHCLVLHQNGTNGVIPAFSLDNLYKGLIDDELYPYDDSFNYMIFDKEFN